MSVTVIVRVPTVSSWSEKRRSSTWIVEGTWKVVPTSTCPASTAAATVTSLNTEPAW